MSTGDPSLTTNRFLRRRKDRRFHTQRYEPKGSGSESGTTVFMVTAVADLWPGAEST